MCPEFSLKKEGQSTCRERPNNETTDGSGVWVFRFWAAQNTGHMTSALLSQNGHPKQSWHCDLPAIPTSKDWDQLEPAGRQKTKTKHDLFWAKITAEKTKQNVVGLQKRPPGLVLDLLCPLRGFCFSLNKKKADLKLGLESYNLARG